MPSIEEVLGNRQDYPDAMRVTLQNGYEVNLGDLRAGYMKDADYRKKTAEVAEQRRQTERMRQDWEQEKARWEVAKGEAEAQLKELATQIVQRPTVETRDDLEAALKADPVGKVLIERIDRLNAEVKELRGKADEADAKLKTHETTWMADQHRRVLAGLKQYDPSLDDEKTQRLIQFAKDNYIPRLDMAYRLMTEDDRLKQTAATAREEGKKAGLEEGKKIASQPVVPLRRTPPAPPPDAPKDFGEAATRAAEDPEIIRLLSGEPAE